VSVKDRSPVFATLPSKIAAIIPEGSREDGKWSAKEYGLSSSVSKAQRKGGKMLNVRQDERRMARFAQYAMVASEEALADAGWTPQKEDDLEATVRCVICIQRHLLTQSRVFTWARALEA
jgi:3-oxoacyl-[acyl-carrier-protein] synthase II